MTQLSVDQALQLAAQALHAGELGKTETICRQILSQNPKDHRASYLLAQVARRAGRNDLAVNLLRQSVTLAPVVAEYRDELATTLREMGLFEQAVIEASEVVRLRPDSADARNNLGVALNAAQKRDEALGAFEQAVKINPEHAAAQGNLANLLIDQGRKDEALAAYRRALELNPRSAVTHYNFGSALMDLDMLEPAIAEFRAAIALKFDYPKAHNNLGSTLRQKGEYDQAIAALRQAVALKPDYAEAHNNLGNALRDRGWLDESVLAFREALKLQPNFPKAWNNLGIALKDQAELTESISAFQKAVVQAPDDAAIHSNLVYAMYFHPEYSPKDLLLHHRQWDQMHGEPLKKFIPPHEVSRDPERRIRIGYVSPDFVNHPVGRFMFAPMKAHDHERFEMFAYSSVRFPDSLTPKLKVCADVWRDVPAVSNEKLADIIREDQIDILVDLTMHMAGNRMPLFARKPAPVQVTYLAYAGTTGLSAIDYRITDHYLDPTGIDETVYAEKSVRVSSYWCYHEPIENLPQTPPPSEKNGFITFGCLNNLCKINPATLELWAKVLNGVPNSRLHIHAKSGRHRQRIFETFAKAGVNPDRLSFIDKLPLPEYLREYEKIDIGVDTLHYVGGTTSCDALWMGVPVITMEGTTSISRGGVSIMRNLGTSEFIATITDDFVKLAVELANDPSRLRHLRTTLRQTMRDSVLMDAGRFARELESAYREMWREWCGKS